MTIAKVQVHSMFRDWWETEMSEVLGGLKKEDVISVQVVDGGVWVFYWAD